MTTETKKLEAPKPEAPKPEAPKPDTATLESTRAPKPDTVTLVSTRAATLWVCEPPLQIVKGDNPNIPRNLAERLVKDITTVREDVDGPAKRQGCGTFLTIKN